MTDYIFFMHGDTPPTANRSPDAWPAYLARLRAANAFEGGSAIGAGVCVSKSGRPTPVAEHITGYIRIRAADLTAARALLVGNPVYEAGGTVEIRELPRSD
jgi:hypothetical protein